MANSFLGNQDTIPPAGPLIVAPSIKEIVVLFIVNKFLFQKVTVQKWNINAAYNFLTFGTMVFQISIDMKI